MDKLTLSEFFTSFDNLSSGSQTPGACSTAASRGTSEPKLGVRLSTLHAIRHYSCVSISLLVPVAGAPGTPLPTLRLRTARELPKTSGDGVVIYEGF